MTRNSGALSRMLMSATAIAVMLPSGQAAAQQATAGAAAAPAAGSERETVVVTATRRSADLQDVPVTVTAISGDDLLANGVSDLQDIVALIPNSVIQDNPESFNTFVNIRGMRIVDVQAEPNVGLYRNGLYMGGHRANLGSQVDVERIEVLRGPQGGLYGRSSVGGTVDIIYATPSRDGGGYAKASYGSYKRTEVQGAVNLAVGDTGALRLTGWSFNQTESELFNETLNEFVGQFSDRGLRAGYKVDLSDRLSVLWTLESREWEGPSMRTYAPLGISNFGAMSTPETVDRIRRDTRSDADITELYASQVINYKLDSGELTFNASYKDYGFNSIQDSDQTSIGPQSSSVARQTDIVRDEGTKDYFLEALYASADDKPLTWLLGVSYFNEEFNFARTIKSRRNTPSYGIQTALIGFPKSGTTVETETLSAFATANYDVSDALSLSASLRYSQDTKSLNYSQGVLPTGTGNTALDSYFATLLAGPYPTYVFASESEFDNWSPSVTARFRLSDTLNAYASYGTGFRPGAFNLSPTTVQTIPYGQETATNYEVGLKGSFFDGRLDANIAAFMMRQEDLLLAMQTSLGGVDRTYLDNVGTANTSGIEIETFFRPTSWLTGAVSVGWLDPKFDDAVANRGKPSQQVLSGKLIPYTREWTANAQFDVDAPINDALTFVGGASIRYESGGILGDYYVVDPYDTMTKIDLRAGVETNEGTRITAYVRNLLDEHISQFWFYNRGTNTSEGQTWGVDITQRF
ncbi:MAG: TonB-dependent receptor [Alphaproteobacteria bacterium]|nr:TonB-dependent receptor [Alphaproteobacteria bacterium]